MPSRPASPPPSVEEVSAPPASTWSCGALTRQIAELGQRVALIERGKVGAGENAWQGAFVAPSRLRPDVPVALEKIVMRCLAPREFRYPDARELTADLLWTIEKRAQAGF